MELYFEHTSQHHEFAGDITECGIASGIFHGKKSEILSHIKKANLHLNNKEWKEGFQFLMSLLPYCNEEILMEESLKWVRSISACLTSDHTDSLIKEKAADILVYLLKCVQNYSDLSGVISKCPTNFINNMLHAPPSWRISAMTAIYLYTRLFPGQVALLKGTIEKEVLSYLSRDPVLSAQQSDISLAGRIFCVLPTAGSKSELTKPDSRGTQLSQLTSLGHHVIDILLANIIEKDSYEHTRDHNLPVDLDSLQDSQNGYAGTLHHLYRVLVNVFIFIEEFLCHSNTTSVRNVVKHLVGVTTRILQVDLSTVRSKTGQEFKMLSLLMPSLQQKALSLLSHILQSSGESVSMFYGFLVDLLCQCIVSSHQTARTKTLCYGVLVILFKVSRGSCGIPESLVPVLLQDVTPSTEHLTLKQTSQRKYAMKRKKMKPEESVVEELFIRDSIATKKETTLRRVAGWSFLGVLYRYASLVLTDKVNAEMTQGLLSILAMKNILVTEVPVRRAMYSAVCDFMKNINPRRPVPHSFLLAFFRRGKQDSDIQVADICHEALGSLAYIMANPTVSTYNKRIESSWNGNSHQNVSNLSNGKRELEEDPDEPLAQQKPTEEEEEEVSQSPDIVEEQEEEEEEQVTEEPSFVKDNDVCMETNSRDNEVTMEAPSEETTKPSDAEETSMSPTKIESSCQDSSDLQHLTKNQRKKERKRRRMLQLAEETLEIKEGNTVNSPKEVVVPEETNQSDIIEILEEEEEKEIPVKEVDQAPSNQVSANEVDDFFVDLCDD